MHNRFLSRPWVFKKLRIGSLESLNAADQYRHKKVGEVSHPFPLKAEEKQRAICCDSAQGPCCGDCDMTVSHNCNTNIWNSTSLGNSYTNNTGLDWFVVFAGSPYFRVKEIEVSEITD
jgi:hypothetical protein